MKTSFARSLGPATLPLCLLLSSFLFAACDSRESVSPLPVPSTTATTTATGGAGGEGGADPAPPIRTVEQRHPFGNVAAADNLLWDGDFEWSSAFADQYGWLFGPPYSYDFPPATVGAACRSGIKCVSVPNNRAVIGIGAGSGKAPLSVSVFARPEKGSCADVDVFLMDAGSFAKDVAIPATPEVPDASGWCLYSAAVDSYPERVFLLVDNNTGGAMLVDDAVVRAVPPGEPAPPPPAPKSEPPTAERAAHREAAREALRRLRGPYVPPPNAARRALEERFAR